MNRTALLALLGAALITCGRRDKPKPVEHPRPVKVMVLNRITPLRPVQVSGSVTPWREDDIAFEVTGRITMMVDRQTYLEGQWKKDGKILHPGQVLARLDTEPFTIQRDTAQAQLVVSQRELVAAQVELDKVLPARRKASEVQLKRADAELKRKEQAYRDKAVSEIELIRSQADRDGRLADIEGIDASVEQQKATIEGIRAKIKAAQQEVRQAEYNLSLCTLYAPFDGEVSDLFTVAGGYARAGTPVLHLIMMDPVKVDVAVAPETARSLGVGDTVNLYLPGDSEPKRSTVFQIATAADPDTRTFRVSLLARNMRSLPGIPPDDPRQKATRTPQFMYLSRERFRSGKGPYFVEENRCLRKDDQGYYVWHIKGYKYGDSIKTGTMLPIEKVRVKPGDTRVNRQGILLFRSLEDAGGLEGGALLPFDIPEDFDGNEVLLMQEQWSLQPGQVVEAVLKSHVPTAGLYAPMVAIDARTQETGTVFVVADGTVRRVPVRILEHVGAFFHIVAADDEGRKLLVPGAQIVIDYVHFLRDGESVKVTGTVKATP